MSFQEQERALFDLLFDPLLRAQFCQHSTAALAAYAMEDHELEDFRSIRPDAIELDASMRTYLILTQVCRQFPLTFSLLTSFAGGKELIKSLINLQTMHCHPTERATVYGSQLREQLTNITFDSTNEQAMVMAVLEAELGMVWTSASLKQQILQNKITESELHSDDYTINNNEQSGDNYLQQPVKLAAYVSVAIIPRSYVHLKSALCPCEDTALWAHLSKQPLSVSRRKKILEHEAPKLFITRAHVSKFSRCEPTVDHYTVELSDGFAPLFQHINGSNSVAQITGQLRQIGATEEILLGVETGFHQLITNGMLECL